MVVDLVGASRAQFEIFDDAGLRVVAGSFDGYVFETILPAPASAGVLALGGLVAARRRR